MATQSFVTSDMQSLQVQQRIPLQVTTGQQSQATVQKIATTQPQTFVVQKTVTLPSNAENYSNHGQKSVAQGTTILQPTNQGYSGQQFIVTIPRDPANSENMQEVEIQQGTPSQVIYQSGHNSQQNYSDYNPVYNPVTGTYYHASGSGQMTQLGGLQGQIVQGGTYLVSSAMDGDGQHITHTTRASPATVQWLIDNYETAEGVSLPRSTLYNHYLRHCQEQKIDPMNPASFGKLIRSVFLGLRTRRLGTRGNSKYHYYGIRIKPDSPLNAFTDDHALPMRQQSLSSAKRFKSVGGASDGKEVSSSQAENTQQFQNQQFLGDASGAIPAFGCVEIKSDELPEGLSIEHVRIFEDLFKKHCEQILQTVVNLQFSEVEKIWQTFWRTTPSELRQNSDMVAEQRLSKDKLYAMSRLTAVRDFVRRSDYTYYQALVEVLIPDVLRPIPSSLTQAVRNFAKSLENWLKSAMVGVPDDMIKTKVSAVSAFAQTLRRYTSLNHLAQAARAVLQNTTQINQMLNDLNRVDFANVQEQASWVCQCEDGVVQQIQEDFKKTLQGQNSLESWAIWLEGVVNQVLAPHEGGPNFAKAARQFLLKWSFYSSMVIRDLTLRSAASFGSFHLIRLLYDEYMFYLVEHKVAAATDESPIAVMGEVRHQSMDASGSFGNDMESKVQLQGAILNSASRSSSLTLNSTNVLNSVHVVSSAAVQPATVASTPNLGLQAAVASGTLQATAVASPKLTQVTTLHGVNNVASGSPKIGSISGLQAGNSATVAVVASGAGGTGPKTIVVVPVSASTAGSGDAQPTVKRIKTA